jgi:hypothetical protein
VLRQELNSNPSPVFSLLTILNNAATSDYRGLQVEYQRRLSRGLQGLASYSWGRSLDNVSGDSVPSLTPSSRLDPQQDRGPSDFDVRHSFNAGFTYEIPAPSRTAALAAVLRGWSVNGLARARSATPVNVTINRNFGFGSYAFRPDVVPGAPWYVDDPSVPGGRKINKDAFVAPTELRQGTLGRNALRGFAMSQIDLGVQRRFHVARKTTLQFSAEFFNLLNTPNFAEPAGTLTSGLFGVSTQMLGRSLGSGGVNGGFSPLYQIGGPRSTQLTVRLQY